MPQIIIIGAGLTGLSAAYHLEKKGFTDYIIIEKELKAGGLCRSVFQDGFIFDYTGHLLHSNNAYFDSFIREIGHIHFNKIDRHSAIYSQSIYTDYPYQQNLYGLPTPTIIECIEGYLSRETSIEDPKSFAEWVLKFFGVGFGKNFFFPYQQKLLKFDPKKLMASWTGRFVPNTSLRDILYGALEKRKSDVGYNASFLYPRSGGIQVLADALAAKVKSKIMMGVSVVSVDVSKKIVFLSDGNSFSYDTIITTMPLDSLLKSIEDSSTTSFVHAVAKLKCTSVVCLNLGLSRGMGNKHWIYYPEKKYPWYRVGFYNNFSSSLVPPGCSSLYCETAYRRVKNKQVIIDNSRKRLKRLLRIGDGDIVTENVLFLSHAYVVYDAWREKNLTKILERLQVESIYSIGRYGAWKYSSMQESILDGKEIAEKVTIQPAKTFFSFTSVPTCIPGGRKEHEIER